MAGMTATRRDFCTLAAALGAGALLPGELTAGEGGDPGRPNVLFIAVDDLRPQLGCHGHGFMRTPHIDALAASGTLFERAYCNVPVCGASRASLMTGLRPTPERFLGYNTRKGEDAPAAVSLPRAFRDAGYRTASVGKIYHHGNDDREAWSSRPWRSRMAEGGEWVGRGYLAPASREIVGDEKGWRAPAGPAWEAAEVDDDAYPDGRICAQAIAELDRLRDGPFFLAAGFLKPHLPFAAPRRYWDLYDHDAIDLADNPFRPEGAPDAAFHNWGELRQYHGIPKKGALDEATARKLIHGYYACTSYADALVGRLLAALEEKGLAENTVVVLWGDHGWNLGEHGMWCKHCNFETSLHSPLMIRAPGMPAGNRCRALTEFVDVYPTLGELAGIDVPANLAGRSAVPLLADPDAEWKDAVYSRYYAGDSVKTDRYRYTRYRSRKGAGEFRGHMLYDHREDPHENRDLSADPEHAEVVAELAARLDALRG